MNKKEIDLYRDEMLVRMARLEEKHLARFEVTKELRFDVKSLNGRVRTLENRQSWFAGTLATITFIFSSLIAWIKGAS